MFHKVKNVSALPVFDYFKDNIEEFSQVSVDLGGYGIVWNDELDISCAELWEHGTQMDA